MSPQSLSGKRVLTVGPALAALATGPLSGAHIEAAGLERLIGISAADTDLILIDADAWSPPSLAAAVQALSLCPAPPPVLLVGVHLPTAVVRGLLRMERSDVLDAPYAPEVLSAVIATLLEAKPARAVQAAPTPHAVEVARCWAVIGAVGGSGATTIAIEVATQLCARQTKDKSVCLIDMHLADGSAAAYLGAHPTLRLAELGAAAEKLDAAMLQAFVTPVNNQLDLLAAPRDPDGFEAAPREAILRMLEVACESYDWVILDMPRHRRGWSLEALGGCDEVLVVSELTVPALLAARSLSDEIERDLGSGRKPKIVLNRLASRMFGPAPSMAEAEKALQRKAEAGVSSDWEAAAASVNLGGPIAMHRPKSKIVKDIQTMVERLAAQPARNAVKAA
ncbi:AAA family ATPase [Phenylobacterium sp.]|jgi:pilus assembly protein CpaE|uniref:AAA family ATPase n=1 Tax=Phenylobacterium sp. TaxID=1871053 RepID=UPI002E322533|nr:cellulose synthase operon protein YhjQ/BcsQ [Phenylobacterium sp.]HEX3366848.1 cellulose synthase operon protein YhjQ/BcsQ [Phenylobacterium sp.]